MRCPQQVEKSLGCFRTMAILETMTVHWSTEQVV